MKARSSADAWDIASGVGLTAVMVALARAAEAKSVNPLVCDYLAETLVSTPELADVRDQIARWWSSAEETLREYSAANAQHMIDYQAVRTRFFDDFYASCCDAGIRQHVILAAGLDSRAYRLDWPPDSVVYEIDLPKVLEYKSRTLMRHGARPRAIRREVAADLRDDWLATLKAAGFDATAPTAWLAEGLLPYLPGPVQERLFNTIEILSCAGSRVALEALSLDDVHGPQMVKRWNEAKQGPQESGDDIAVAPFELFSAPEGRPDCGKWFIAHGWAMHSVESGAELRRHRRATAPKSYEEQPYVSNFVLAERRAAESSLLCPPGS